MAPVITNCEKRILVGMAMEMSLLENKTGLLWSMFSPRINSIGNRLSDDKISMQIYPESYFNNFDPGRKFIKWASVEVNLIDELPLNLETFEIPEGLYAVFHYKGLAGDTGIFRYIFQEWLPQSEYTLDNRPHFEIIGEKYRNNDPDSEEDIYIPIKVK